MMLYADESVMVCDDSAIQRLKSKTEKEFMKLTEVESRTQGSRPRPRTQKKSEAKAKAKDSLSEDRHSRGQGQECSRPRPRTKDTSASAIQKKKVFTKIFQAISTKKCFPKNFSSAPQNFNNSKYIMLSSSRGQANFRGLEASRPRPKTWPSRPRPRTSKSVLEDSTSGNWRMD